MKITAFGLAVLTILVVTALLPTAIAQEVPAHVVISEVFYDESGTTDDNEFCELYNPTDSDIAISGWKLKAFNQAGVLKTTTTFPAGTTITAHKFYLIGEKDPLNSADWGGTAISPDCLRGGTDWQNGPDDYLVLENGTGTYVDGVRWGHAGSNNPPAIVDVPDNHTAPDAAMGKSIERKSLNGGYGPCQDTNNNSIDFFVQDTPTPKNSASQEMDPPCACGDICVNETGWWRDGGVFNPSNTPIQHAIDNATAGDTICVKDGTYNETVDVTKSHLTIRSANGPSVTTVSASLNPDDHVFDITDQTNITLEGFEIRDARGTFKGVAGINMNNASNCNISDNFVTNISATGWFDGTYGIYLSSSSDNNSFVTTTVFNLNAYDYAYAYGIRLDSSSNNSFVTTTVYNLSSANTEAYGIYLSSSSDNNSFVTSTVYNLSSANRVARGIQLSSSNGNSFVTTTVYNLDADNVAHGIRLSSSNDNSFVTTTVYNLSADGSAYGIDMFFSNDNNSFVTTTVYNLDADGSAYGIDMSSSNDNSFDTTTVYNLDADDVANGIRLSSSSDNSFDTTTVYNLSSANTGACGILLISSSDNNSFLTTTVYNLSAAGEADGIDLCSSSDNSFVTTTVYNLSSANNDAYGILLYSSSDKNSFVTTTVYNLSSAGAGYYGAFGIALVSSSDNSFVTTTVYNLFSAGYSAYGIYIADIAGSNDNSFVTTTVYNISANYGNAFGIELSSSSDNSFVTTTVYNISANYGNAFGIELSSSSDNSFDTSTVYNISSADGDASCIALYYSSDNNSFDTSTVYNISANGYALGIYLYYSSDNSFTSGSISDVNAPTWWDFYSEEDVHGNSAEDITISSIATTISFTYDNGIKLKSVQTPPADPADKLNISKYVNVTDVTANSWIFMNVSYEEGVLGGVAENSLRMWKHNGTDWTEVPGTNGVNTAENYVYANITEFGSIFAPLGNPPPVPPLNCTCGDICVNTSGWWRDGGAFNASNTPIQHAIDNTTAGDTICVKDGTYTETVDVTKSHLTIRSENGPSVTTVSASLNHNKHVFNITDQTNVTLEGFEIRDAHGTNQDVAGIYMNNASECDISDNIVTDISATGSYNSPFGIWLDSSSDNSFDRSTVYNLSADYGACGIGLSYSSDNNSFHTSTVYNLSANSNAYGIYLDSSSDNSFVTTTVYNLSANGGACGIGLSHSSDNSFDRSTVYNLSANWYAYGIGLSYLSDNNSFDTSTVYNLSANSNAYGIWLDFSSDNSFVTSTAYGLSANDAYGIHLCSSSDNSFDTSTVYNLSANWDAYGIYLDYSSENTFSSGSISDINAPDWWDFYSEEDAHGNSAEDIMISSFPTTISFTYDNGIKLKSVDTPPADPAGKRNISKYVNVTEVTADSWIFLNVSYEEGDLGNVDEDTLRMWKYNGTWTEVPSPNGVNTVENYVYANITEFSVFAPLGNVTGAAPNITSFAPPSQVNDTVCNWRTFNVTVNQTVNVSWYLNNTLQHTNVSTKEANYTLHAEVVGEHNVSAKAENVNGTDMQTWVWNVTAAAPVLNCTCGDICVNTTGWWRDGGAFNASNTPIQHAIDNAAAGDTICVKDGTYNENVDVTKSHLTIRSENGPSVTTVSASLNPDDHVFDITDQTDVTLEGFEIRDGHGTNQDVAGIYMNNASKCNISNNIVTNISATDWVNAYGIWLEGSSDNSFGSSTDVSYINFDVIWWGGGMAYGIYIGNSNNNSFSSSTSVSYINSSILEAHGIFLYYSNNNSFNSSTDVSNINAFFGEASGITLWGSNNNSFSSSTNVFSITAFVYANGIRLLDSNNNRFDSSTSISYIDGNHEAFGILLEISTNNRFSSSTSISYVNATIWDAFGIYLWLSSDNSFTSGSISDINAPDWWDFYSEEDAHRNSARDITISSFPTTISFTYDNGIKLKSVATPPADPAGKQNISKYVNAAEVTADSWIFMNVSYAEGDLGGVEENSLRLWKHNGTDWTEVPGTNGVNTAENYVYANITDFGSIFAPLGNVTGAKAPNITSFAPPSPVNDTVCTWRTFNITANQTVNVSWYLNDSHLFTNDSVTEANYTLHAEFVGDNNVSAVASNANGTDMQTWAWNVTAGPLPVLEINKTDNPDLVSPGGTLNYSIRVNNTGNATATNVTVMETYDGNVTFVAAVPAPSSGDDTWQFPTLNVSETRWINISVTVNASVLNGTVLHNIVNVTCDEGVSDSDTEDTTVFAAPAPPPNITSFAPPSPVNDTVCNWRTFNVTVNQTVNVSWYLNESFLFTNTSAREASCTRHAEVAGEHNVSAVASNANGTDMQMWIWNVTGAVPPAPPGISVNKVANPPDVAPSSNVEFTITVPNTGDCTLNPVRVVDTLPGWMSYVSSSPAADTHDGTIIWNNVGPLDPGDSKTIKLVARIASDASGTLTNAVTVTGTSSTGEEVTDSDTVTVTVLAKTIEPSTQTLIDVTTEIKSDGIVIEDEQFGWMTGNGNLLNNPPLSPGEAVGGIKYDEKMIGSNGTTEFTKNFGVNTNVTPNLAVTKDIGYKSGDLGSLSYDEQVGMRYSGASPPLSSTTKCEDVNAHSKMVVTDVDAATETEVGITETDERDLHYGIDAKGKGSVSAGVDASASSMSYKDKSTAYGGNFSLHKKVDYTSKPSTSITTDLKGDSTVVEEGQFRGESGSRNLLHNDKMIGSNGTTEFEKCVDASTTNLEVDKSIGYTSGDLGSLSNDEQVGMRYSSTTKCEDVNAYGKMVATNATTKTEARTTRRSVHYEIDAEGKGTVSAGVDASVEDGRTDMMYEDESIAYGNFTFSKEIGYNKPP